jgi:hypothetical protein
MVCLRRMKTAKGVIILEDAKRFSPDSSGVTYTDESEMTIHIPMKLLVRLYEGARFHMDRDGTDWNDFCDTLFESAWRCER